MSSGQLMLKLQFVGKPTRILVASQVNMAHTGQLLHSWWPRSCPNEGQLQNVPDFCQRSRQFNTSGVYLLRCASTCIPSRLAEATPNPNQLFHLKSRCLAVDLAWWLFLQRSNCWLEITWCQNDEQEVQAALVQRSKSLTPSDDSVYPIAAREPKSCGIQACFENS